VVLRLAARGDLRTLIRFVECWREQADPTDAAILAQARAFQSLNLLDRALARLNDLSTDGAESADALTLRAQLLVVRGMSTARDAVEKALQSRPGEPQLLELLDDLDRPNTLIDEAVEREPDAHPDVLLRLSERHLLEGSLLKARRILERLKRLHPDNQRVLDLLWVLEGDFSIEGSLSELAERYRPTLADLPELSDESEHTESVARADLILADEPESHAFPSLFRGVGMTEPYDAVPEVTQAQTMADLQLLHIQDDEVTGEADTQILRVVDNKRLGSTDQIHAEVPPVRADFDLEDFRRQMGMVQNASDFTHVESEDDELIVFKMPAKIDLQVSVGDDIDLLELDPPTEARDTPKLAKERQHTEPKSEKKRVSLAEKAPKPMVSSPFLSPAQIGDEERTITVEVPAPDWAYWAFALTALISVGVILLAGFVAALVLT
jgi:tetratricopeptide (TPR) repeat protein